METGILRLIEELERLAPEMWSLAILQVKIQARIELAFTIVLLIVGLWSSFRLWRKWLVTEGNLEPISRQDDKRRNYNHWIENCGGGWFIAGAIVGGFVGLTFLILTIQDFGNPGFQALKLLMRLVA